jgi:hypothetical protein
MHQELRGTTALEATQFQSAQLTQSQQLLAQLHESAPMQFHMPCAVVSRRCGSSSCFAESGCSVKQVSSDVAEVMQHSDTECLHSWAVHAAAPESPQAVMPHGLANTNSLFCLMISALSWALRRTIS